MRYKKTSIFNKQESRKSVRDDDHERIVSDTYVLQHQEQAIRPEYAAHSARKRAQSSVSPRDKDHRNCAWDTYNLK
jgi:hypothetical protein